METHARSVAKALTWRLTAWLITTIVVYIVTGEAALAASIGLLDAIIKLSAYYGHERLWLRLAFGRRPPDYET